MPERAQAAKHQLEKESQGGMVTVATSCLEVRLERLTLRKPSHLPVATVLTKASQKTQNEHSLDPGKLLDPCDGG